MKQQTIRAISKQSIFLFTLLVGYGATWGFIGAYFGLSNILGPVRYCLAISATVLFFLTPFVAGIILARLRA